MATADEIAETLLDGPAGIIAAVNILDGLSDALYDEPFAAALLRWWGEYVVQSGRSGLDTARALGSLIDIVEGRGPPGFIPPGVSLPGLHIKCRREDTTLNHAARASVKDAAAMHYWADSVALADLADDGIDILARRGTPSYRSTMRALEPTHLREISLDLAAKSTITNGAYGKNAIMFFTLADELLPRLQALAPDERADAARDLLGLVHVAADVQHIVVILEAEGTELRDDRGRPTVVDSGGNTRFLGRCHGSGADPWGRTADLAKVPSDWPDVTGLKERVCGPFPSYDPGRSPPPQISVYFLGAAEVARGDVIGVGDAKFASEISERWEIANSMSVRDKLVELLKSTGA